MGRRGRPYAATAAFAFVLVLPAVLAATKLHDSFRIDWVWTDQFAGQLGQGMLYPRWLPASNDGALALALLLASLIFRRAPRRDERC